MGEEESPTILQAGGESIQESEEGSHLPTALFLPQTQRPPSGGRVCVNGAGKERIQWGSASTELRAGLDLYAVSSYQESW